MYKYCLCVVDNFSKMGFMRPLKRKASELVVNALEDIFKKSKRVPEKIHHDEGGSIRLIFIFYYL